MADASPRRSKARHVSALVLDAAGLTVRFGGLTAVDDVSFRVAEGSVHGLIGPNGAGKTTVFNVVSGLSPLARGEIRLAGHPIESLPSWSRARLGLARTFQNIRMFSDMTAIENVMTGMCANLHEGIGPVLFRLPVFRTAEREALLRARELLEFVGLDGARDRRGGDLSYGDQRRLEIARALAGNPRLLMLDEPAAGMNPTERRTLADLIRRIGDRGITLLLVEHDIQFVMSLCHAITVLNFGRVIADGTPDAVRRSPSVIEAYLGPEDRGALRGAT